MLNNNSLTRALSTTTTSTATQLAVLPDQPPAAKGLKFPLVCVTPFGTISIMMGNNVNIEISVDRSIHVVCWNKFAVSSNQKGTRSGILHPFGHIMQEDDKVYCYFYPGNSNSNCNWNTSASATATTNMNIAKQSPPWISKNNAAVMSNKLQQKSPGTGTSTVAGITKEDSLTNLSKMAILGTQGVLFSMSHLKDAFLVSAAASRGTSSLSMDRIQFPSLRWDYTLRHFYDSQLGEEHIYTCNNIVQRAKYSQEGGKVFSLSINGFFIRQKPNGDVEVYSRPRQIICSPSQSTVHLRCSNVEMEVQTDEKAYVHVSRSGMVVSDGNCTTSMDHIGRIVSAS